MTSKILVVNTLVGSLFVYKMSTVLTLSEDQLHEIEVIIRDFIWSGKKPKIAYKTLCKKQYQGGLRLVDLRAKQDCIFIGNMFRLQRDKFLMECAYDVLSKNLRELIWKCNLKPQHICELYDIRNFWVQMLLSVEQNKL